MSMQKFKFNSNIKWVVSALSTAMAFCCQGPVLAALVTEDSDVLRYQEMLLEHEQHDDRKKAFELIASGAAAAMVGVYGYHFDNRGVLAGLAYAGTQTAGILVIGEGIRRYYGTSVVTAVNRAMDSSEFSKDSLRKTLLDNSEQMKQAKLRSDAWVAGLLGGIYMYNAVRTPSDSRSVRNVFVFLSVNAIAVSGYSSYKLYHAESGNDVGFEISGSGPRFFVKF
jgi:hypothetical protein